MHTSSLLPLSCTSLVGCEMIPKPVDFDDISLKGQDAPHHHAHLGHSLEGAPTTMIPPSPTGAGPRKAKASTAADRMAYVLARTSQGRTISSP